MLLAPTRPRPKPSQSEFSSDLSTQREDDPESGLMHYRARSYDLRNARFLSRDPAPESRIAEHYAYVRGDPLRNTDPTGERTYVTFNKRLGVVKVITRIAVSNGDDVPRALEVADMVASGIHTFWNNGGLGWDISFRDNSGDVHKAKLLFEPEVIAMPESMKVTRMASGLGDFDYVHLDLWRHQQPTASTNSLPFHPNTHYDPRYPITPRFGTDPNRVVNAGPSKNHYVTASRWANAWDYAHEYGHVMGMVERYTRPGAWADIGYAGRIMGTGRVAAAPADIDELFNGPFGITLKTVAASTGPRFSQAWATIEMGDRPVAPFALPAGYVHLVK